MVALPQQYNTADLPDTGGNIVLIPQGQYQATIVKSEMVENKAKTGSFLALTVVITQGDYANTEFTERLNVVNPNETAVQIAYKTLARISEAVGMNRTPADSTELHNKPFMIEVQTKAGEPYKDNNGVERQGKDQSEIKKYLPLPTGGAPVGAPVQPAAPVASPPPAQQATATPPPDNPFAN